MSDSISIEYVAIDPVLGEISCSNSEQAIDYALSCGGRAYKVNWRNGRSAYRRVIADYSNRKAIP